MSKSSKATKTQAKGKSGKGEAEKDFELPRLTPGLVIFSGLPADHQELVRGACEYDMRIGTSRGAVRFGRRNVTALRTGPSQLVRVARQLASSFVLDPEKEMGTHQVEHLDTTGGGNFDWSSSEGRHLLSGHMTEGECLTIAQVVKKGTEDRIGRGLAHIARDAEAAKAYVIFFAVASTLQAEAWASLGVDVVEISPCERDPGATLAFCAQSLAATPFHGLGLGRVMCNLYMTPNQTRRTYQPFFTDKLETRAMWLLSGQGLTYEQIGQVFGKDRTTILRRLQSLPPPRKLPAKKDWFKPYAEHLGLDLEEVEALLVEVE